MSVKGTYENVAQLAEQLTFNQLVMGSSPIVFTAAVNLPYGGRTRKRTRWLIHKAGAVGQSTRRHS